MALLLPLAFSAESRADYCRLGRREWLLLFLVALIGGSVSYALYFRGLQLTTPVTASLVDHTQFIFVALFAAVFIGERFSPAMIALERMDQCRISWGRVTYLDGAEMVVNRAPLVMAGGKLALGRPVPMRILRQIDGRGYLDDFRPGEMVSIHWNWACDGLSASALRALSRCSTRQAITHTNKTL